jgi:hypothetical protein
MAQLLSFLKGRHFLRTPRTGGKTDFAPEMLHRHPVCFEQVLRALRNFVSDENAVRANRLQQIAMKAVLVDISQFCVVSFPKQKFRAWRATGVVNSRAHVVALNQLRLGISPASVSLR